MVDESFKPSKEIVWDNRADPPLAPSTSTSKENEYEWQRRELPEASTPYVDVRLDGDVPLPADVAEQLALANDFEWSRRSPELADPAKREKGRAAAAAGARWSGIGTAPESPTPDTDPERKGHSNGFIMVDKRSPPSSKPTFLVPIKRDHSDILWEFIPEDQTRMGSV
ncbi:hypothetical protein QFC19_002919 [Naganishia cerealis]|uniref:Uncharacterized protein n=1 Tax=Naganishia cerealis TaxID=610337 RepID=A0ACC2W5N3_9TREE|nr:hypothetical protein QFC19_002919 [Naganishia cerealis]